MFFFRNRSVTKKVALSLAVLLLAEAFFPTFSYALTGGPSQPEFSSFEPVVTTNMVNDFTGDFTYNLPVLDIPGPHGSGYSMSLSYHSGSSPEEEASWVGYGWTLNPGSVSRNTRGFPDDYKAASVKYWNQVPKNWTVSVGGSVGNLELFSYDALTAGVNASLRYNNYKGFGYVAGLGVSVKGIGNLGYSVSDGEGSFSMQINPVSLLSSLDEKDKNDGKKPATKEKRVKLKDDALKAAQASRKKVEGGGSPNAGNIHLIGGNYGLFTHSDAIRSTKVTPYKGLSTNVSIGLQTNPAPAPVGATYNMFGNYTYQQNANDFEDLNTYGYMYSGSIGSDNDMMDYYLEKDAPYTKRDKFLAIPFSNADNFAMTGEGIMGGFRLYNRNAGHFRPNYAKSNMDIIQAGYEYNLGLEMGTGGDIGVGLQSLEVKKWDWNTANSGYNFASTGDEPYFFRFNNDLGGSVSFSDDNKVQATVGAGAGTDANSPYIPSSVNSTMNGGERSGRASYIAYHTNNEIYNKNYKAYTKLSEINSLTSPYLPLVDRSKPTVADGIGEVAVTNENGETYVYGLPVYSRNEKTLQYDVEVGTDYYQVTKDLNNIKRKVGEERNNPYASSFLLTKIVTPDYVDRTNNGPSSDDFGGYTKFSYTRYYGTDDKGASGNWYNWRIPYNGLLFHRNELSDRDDDMGSVASGEKEIYYLSLIETKTHIAEFTLDPVDRTDGMDAASDPVTAAASTSAKGGNTLKKLKKISLYAKDQNGNKGQLIKTVNFSYSQSLMSGIPNGSTGKLRLDRVWFEYQGVANAMISPYIFGYEYKAFGYPAKYSSLDNYGNYTSSAQNPGYAPHNLDAWGNYQLDGATRYNEMRPGVDQKDLATGYDPAAWQLKTITLPSGGQIHVQYEQKDYSYVQDKAAMALVRLLPATSGSVTDDGTGKFYLDVSDLGSSVDKEMLKTLINKYIVAPKEKIYFKFLYKLLGSASTAPDLTKCNTEYVTGYAEVESVNTDSKGIYIQLDRSSADNLPLKVCRNFVKTQKMGKLEPFGDCLGPKDSPVESSGALQTVISFLSWAGSLAKPGDTELCTAIDYSKSYLRIPLIKGKKGGGVRVKRLLMFDAGIEAGDASLYGSEYIYETFDEERGYVTSSGVATNEPSSNREENPLVNILPRHKQSLVGKIIAGKDKTQLEGPIGESLLPSASIGYSKVIIKSIHSGKTNTGFNINEFYTAKDYPLSKGADMTNINNDVKDWMVLPGGLVNIAINNVWLTQGYRFILHDLHGQKKSISNYGGDYASKDTWVLSGKQEYTYYAPGENIPVMEEFGKPLVDRFPGKEMEVVFESKGIEDISKDANVEFDIGVGVLIIPLPFGSIFPSIGYNESKIYTHVTSKVIRYPVIPKSVLTYKDGIYHYEQNLAFSPETGKPVLTKTTDGFDKLTLMTETNHNGSYLSYVFPASLQYPSMGQKAANERAVINSNATLSISFNPGTAPYLQLSSPSSNTTEICNAMKKFFPGDLIEYTPYTSTTSCPYGNVYHIDRIDGYKVYLLPSSYNTCTSTTSPIQNVSVEIIKSGRTNQLNSEAGSLVTYGKGYDNFTTVNSPAFTARQALVNEMNNDLWASGTVDVTGSNYSIVRVNSGSSQGTCTTKALPNFAISFTQSSGLATFSNKGVTPLPAKTSLVTSLNTALQNQAEAIMNVQPLRGDIVGCGYSLPVGCGSICMRAKLQLSSDLTCLPTDVRNRPVFSSHVNEFDLGLIIGTDGSYNNDPNWVKKSAMDNNLSTVFIAPTASTGWVGKDIGTPTPITKIAYAPRAGFESRMIGGKFQGSNDPTFATGTVDLYTVTSAPTANVMTYQTINVPYAFRYVRYLSAPNYWVEVSELGFYSDYKSETSETIEGSKGPNSYPNNPYWAVDDDLTTYMEMPSDGGHAGYSFVNPVKVTGVAYAGRSGYESRVLNAQMKGTNGDGPTFLDRFNSPSTGNLLTIATAPQTNRMLFQKVTSSEPYKYLGYFSAPSTYGSVAEVAFYSDAPAGKCTNDNLVLLNQYSCLSEHTSVAGVMGVYEFTLDYQDQESYVNILDVVLGTVGQTAPSVSYIRSNGGLKAFGEFKYNSVEDRIYFDPVKHKVDLCGTSTAPDQFPISVVDQTNNLLYNQKNCGCSQTFAFDNTSTGSGYRSYGSFGLDALTGDILFYPGACNGTPVVLSCLSDCSYQPTSAASIGGVIATGAQTYKDQWTYNDNASFGTGFNAFEKGERGKWRGYESYAYQTSIVNTNNVYKDGEFKDYKLFNWKNTNANTGSKWTKVSTSTGYSRDGNGTEEKDILDIYSAAKFGYNGNLPYLVAQNSPKGTVYFESFEKDYGGKLEDNLSYTYDNGQVVTTTAHAGKGSFKLTPINGFEIPSFAITNQILSTGLGIKVWVKSSYSDPSLLNLKALVRRAAADASPLAAYTFSKVAQVGEWGLYEVKIKDLSNYFSLLDNTMDLRIYYQNYGSESVWIDDIRIQPLESQMTAYVYDPTTFRLVATFDDQNFGLYYQYNAEGKLVRKLVETVKGMKTVTETQYNVPKTSR